ncbi:MAG: LysR family transcriptional regulator [Phycisphaerae bacterium]
MARRQKRSVTPRIRARVWVEIDGVQAISESAADLLEQIVACGSLSQAARRLRFSYRRAWLLLDGLNRRWPRPLALTATGGVRGGGSRVTEQGVAVLSAYRAMQIEVEALLDRQSGHFRRLASRSAESA